MKTTLLSLLICAGLATGAPVRPKLVMVLVIDGLRPDSITPAVMPNLDRLKSTGVWFTRSHSMFPTVTRVNATSITTGMLPAHHGIVSNSIYLPAVSPKVLSNGDYRNLMKLGDRPVVAKTLHEYLEAAGVPYIAVSSGSTGSSMLLNPTAPYGSGRLINGGFEDGKRVAYPDALNEALLEKFGPVKGGEDGDQALLWVERVLREYVLDTVKPRVVVDWLGRSDSAQHGFGVSSPEGLAALRLIDGQIGLLLTRLKELKIENQTDIIVTCDHGFDYEPAADVLAPLRESGLERDAVVDHEGGSTLLYVKNHDAEKIARLVEKFQASEMTNAVFVAAKRPSGGTFVCTDGAEQGFAAGTFALELAGECSPSRGADVIVTYKWNSDANPFGVAGTQWVPGAAGQAAHHGHGGLNPYVTHSTLIAHGPDFEAGRVVEVPAGNPDIAATVLALEGVGVPEWLDGRVLWEAMRKPAGRAVKGSSRSVRASKGEFCSVLEISYAGKSRYLDQAKRCGAR